MTLKISVRDYRGLERADVELAPIAIAAGRNEQGKSCLAQAARAVLAGVAIPIPGVAKKDAKLLVRDGADEGRASASNGTSGTTVLWPKCDMVTGTEEAPWCSHFAVGLRHLLDLDDKERANVLAGYIDSAPGVTDLAAALGDLGYSEKAVDSLWKKVSGPDGWDGAYKQAREYSTKIKGQWEGVTGEKYGSKKAESWVPKQNLAELLPGIPEGVDIQREDIEGERKAAETELERTIGALAVAGADTERLRTQAAQLKELDKQERTAAAEKDRLFDEHRALQVKALPPVPQAPMACPCCEKPLSLDKTGKALVEVTDAPTEEDIAAALNAREERKQELEAAHSAFEDAYRKHQTIHAELIAARRAVLELEKFEEQEGGSATDADVEAARERLANAQQALKAFEAKTQADKLHAEVARNDQLAAVLAPDGLRRRKLAAGLDQLNDVLSELCTAAKWPKVRIDESLNAHYGTRPVWAASASGQWRARVIIQVAMAKFDGSAAVVIDEADILDAKGRNGLMAMIQYAEARALICLTANKPELVPDLAKAGLGASYWIAAGVAQAIGETKEEAA